MDYLVATLPVIPLFAAFIIGIRDVSGLMKEASEQFTVNIASAACVLAILNACILLLNTHADQASIIFSLNHWLVSEQLNVSFSFFASGFRVQLATFFLVLVLLIIRFSRLYMQRETGFHRFFALLCFFNFAFLMLLLSANLVGTFIGWVSSSLCAYFLIALPYHHQDATINANRAFISNRVGDAGFILGMGLCFGWLGSIDWKELTQLASDLEPSEANLMALCFATAAFARSAQIPFSPWLARAMEGPIPVSALLFGAVFMHTGVILLILLQPLFMHAEWAMTVLIVIGLLTSAYGYMVGLTQTDINKSLSFAIMAQLGLMFAECGFGFWQVAVWHLIAHAVVRSYQILNSPSIALRLPTYSLTPFPEPLSKPYWAYVASMQGFWLDPLIDWMIVQPAQRLSKDLGYFDEHILDATIGSPAPTSNALSSLAQLEEQKISAQLENEQDVFSSGSGLAGKLTDTSANLVNWLESKMLIRGLDSISTSSGQKFGRNVNKIEQLLIRPRYLSILVFITLLVAF